MIGEFIKFVVLANLIVGTILVIKAFALGIY